MFVREGIPFFAGSFLLALLFSLLGARFFSGGAIFGLPFAVAGLFFLWFFRDPERKPEGDGILSPADGKVILVDSVSSPYGLEGRFRRIAIFMSPFDVHVNRSPCDCVVRSIRRFEGGFARAFLRHSEKNTRVAWVLSADGDNFVLVQIAGALARRIRVWKREGESLKRGERIGMIMFGSRVDLYLPEGKYEVLVREGQKVFAGKTVVARKIF